MKRLFLFVWIAVFVPSLCLAAQPEYDLLVTGSGRVVRFAPNFSVRWEYPAGNISDVQLLKNGNVLFADGRVIEVTPDKKIVFRYEPPAGKEGSFTCRRLENGNTLIGENYSGKVFELAPDGSVAFELQTRFETSDQHHRMRYVRKLQNGHYLVNHSGDHLVREYTANGEVVWEQKVPNIAFASERLENGNTLISSLDQITEYTPDGTIAWEFKTSELPELFIKNITGFYRRANGNLVVGCYAAYDAQGRGVGMFEMTRDKTLLWSYPKPTDGRKVDTNMMGVLMIEPPEKKTDSGH